jgi:serine/threonine protein kinase
MEPVATNCPACGRANRSTARYCGACGATLVAGRAPVAVDTPAVAAADPVAPAAGEALGTAELATATRLGPDGRYRLERLLGKGGFGAAYLAHDTQLDRACVVKCAVLNPDWSPSDRQLVLRNFAREARLLVTLNSPGHPNIPEIYEYLAQSACLVMKYIAGSSLGQMLEDRSGPLPEVEALQYIRDVCSALVYMHSHTPEPVLHRDIKPANLLLGPQGRIWVIDFGLSKAAPLQQNLVIDETTQSAGTIGYTPPEQWKGAATARSDVYALAATLHTLLTGYRPAFSSADLLAVIRGQRDALPPTRQLNPSVRPEVERLIQRALVFDAAARPTSTEFLAELEVLLSPIEIASPPEPSQPPEVDNIVGRTAELD